MTSHRTKKDKISPHYNFLVSWKPEHSAVNREQITTKNKSTNSNTYKKKAEYLAQAGLNLNYKKRILKCLLLVSLMLILELVIYLGWKKFLS